MRNGRVVFRTAVVAGAWLPFFLFWVIFVMSFTKWRLGIAITSGLFSIGGAALLGLAVWRFCRKRPWPTRVRPSFYSKHLVAAGAYAAIWLTALNGGFALVEGKPFLEMLKSSFRSGVIGWQFLMGAWLYGLIAGVSYAIQIREGASESERRALRAESALVAARLDALRSRLNPHFLFNALHTVGALVRQDSARAENAVEKLGDILRHTLRDDLGETVSFREEWALTERYLEFEQLRYEDRLSVSREIDPGSFSCSTPSFALQTLVENAVRHSIAHRVEGGRVEISTRVEDGTFFLRVRDDGPGAGASPAAETRNGYGLRALRERLEAVYGEAASLAVRTGAGAGYEVSITIPCHPTAAESDEQ
jgi:signal transduction histidine kinase